jgi:hypothetical protein
MDARTVAVFDKHLGHATTIKRRFWGGYRIVSRLGEAEFDEDDGFTDVVGGPEMYRATVLIMYDLRGYVAVSGSTQHVVATLAHGEALGIPVIPEVRDTNEGCLTFFVAIVFFCFTPLGGLLGVPIWIIWIHPWLKKRHTRSARVKGQRYRNVFPEIHGSERKADREAARQRGLL